jgi:excinuclease UvrABC nuclease subunit
VFRSKKYLEVSNLNQVPGSPGVYIVYGQDGAPFYVGRSRSSIHDRLVAHAQRRGSKKIREAIGRGERLQFEWEEMISAEQAEAQLIARLGVRAAGNLRRESDPADW